VPNVPMAQKSFWTPPMVLLGDEAEVKAHFGLFGDSAYLKGPCLVLVIEWQP
jgi:hypothetical protein